ncbi:MAG: hypothetical protein OCD03_14070 [Hyphomicrobiales bacterium]
MSGNLINPKSSVIDDKNQSELQAVETTKKIAPKSEYQDDYDQIHSAVLETKRGRWFLGEFARKNKQVESQLVLDALASIEAKITTPKTDSVTTKPKQAPNTNFKHDFKSDEQSSKFGQLFASFKQKTLTSLKWAGITSSLEFSKIQTIINFAAKQSRASIVTQEKKLNAVIAKLTDQNIDKNALSQLRHISSELNKLEKLQSNLNVQLEDGMKFMSDVENISKKPLKNAQKIEENGQKTAKNEQKTAKKQLKTAQNELKAVKNELETLKKQPEKPKIGPAGRIKKMFRIEQTLQVQQAEDLVEPGKAFDEAFASERLAVETKARQVSTVENIEKDIQPKEPDQTKLTEQSEKLAHLGDMMKQVDDVKAKSQPIEKQSEIIIDDDFNALNSLALLSKTERTMLFTLQH